MTTEILRYTFDDGQGGFTNRPALVATGLSSPEFTTSDGVWTEVPGRQGWGMADNGWLPYGVAYFTFSITVSPLYNASVFSISFGHRSSDKGPEGWRLRSSLDGFSTDIASATGRQVETWYDETVQVMAAIPGSVEFRLYGIESTAHAGLWVIDSVSVQGDVYENFSSSSSVSDTSSVSSSSMSGSSYSTLSSSSVSMSSQSSMSSSSSSRSSISSSQTVSTSSGSSVTISTSSSRSSSESSSSSSSSSISSVSSSSSSSSYVARWRLTSIDIDLETGKAFVTAWNPEGEARIVAVDAGNTRVEAEAGAATASKPRKVTVEQRNTGILPFHYETLSKDQGAGTVGFSLDGVTEASGLDLSSLIAVPQVQSQPPDTVHVSEAGVFVWSDAKAGVKATKEGVDGTVDAASPAKPKDSIRLPVFKWSSVPYSRAPAMMVAASDGSLTMVRLSPVTASARTSSAFGPASSLPMYRQPITSIAPGGDTTFIVSSGRVGTVDTDSLVGISGEDKTEDMRVCFQNPYGVVWGVLPSEGQVFSMVAVPEEYGEWPRPDYSSSSHILPSSASSSSSLFCGIGCMIVEVEHPGWNNKIFTVT